jgi:hypothetical protein
MRILEVAQKQVNQLWKEACLPKFIQWGRDGQGSHTHALNGPAAKAVLRNKTLLINTIQHMQPVYALIECNKYTPDQTMVKVKVRTEAASGGASRLKT